MKKTVILWILALAVGLAGLITKEAFSWPQRLYISSEEFVHLWYPIGACFETEEFLSTGVVTPPVLMSHYLLGVESLLLGNGEEGTEQLIGAYQWQKNQFAAFLQANAKIQLIEVHPEIEPAKLYEDEQLRLAIATGYLSIAGRCHVAGEKEMATRYLSIGIFWLPEKLRNSLNSYTSRRVGEIYYYNQQIEEAERWLWQAVPEETSPFVTLSSILSQQGRFVEAIPIYIEALRYYPYRVDLWRGGAQAAREIGDLDKAQWFLIGLETTGKLDIDDMLLWAYVCEKLEDYSCAKELYRQVLQRDKSNQEAIEGLQELRK